MPSGYERHPDYGGPEWTWRSVVLWAAIIAAVAAAFIVWHP